MTPEGLQTFLDESPTKTLDLLHHIQSFNFSWGEVWIHFAFAVFFQRDGVLFSTKWRFGVRYQCHHHLSHDIINHHLVYCSRFEVIEVYILPYLGKKLSCVMDSWSFSHIYRTSAEGRAVERHQKLLQSLVLISASGPTANVRNIPKSMSDQRAEWDINICLCHSLSQAVST